MPPKKKKSGKKKKKSGKKSGKSDVPALPEMIEELNKEYFILHIQDLERRVARYQTKYDMLQQANNGYLSKHGDMTKEKMERVSFLKKSLEQRGDEIADLRDRLVGLQQAKDAEKEIYESQLQQLRTEFQEMKDQLTSENNVLAARLAALEEFKVQKEGLWERYHSLEAALVQMYEDQEKRMETVSQKTVADRDRLKKEMVARVNQVASEFRKVSNKQMAETTKRTIRENVSIQTQLAKMADKNAELVEENEGLKTETRRQIRQIKQLEGSHSQYAKKNSSNEKVVAMLSDRQDEQLEMLEHFEQRSRRIEDLSIDCAQQRERAEEGASSIEVLAFETEELGDILKSMMEEVERKQEEVVQARVTLQDAASALKNLLQAQAPLPSLPPSAMEQEGDKEEETEGLMSTLLEILVLAGIPTEDVSTRRSSIAQIRRESLGFYPDARATPTWPSPNLLTAAQSNLPGAKGIRKQSLTADYLARFPDRIQSSIAGGHCLPGSLQLVPYPDKHIPTHVEKSRGRTGLMAATAYPVSMKTGPVKSVGVQTASAVRALFLADMEMQKTGSPVR